MIGLTATSSTPQLDAWRAKLAGGVAQRIATRVATRMQATASALAPIDTGALSESFAVQGGGASDYGDRVDTANTLNPGVVVFAEPSPPGPDQAAVTSVVEYAAYVNAGTLHQAAQPFWDAARLETEAFLAQDAGDVWNAR